jgi:flagellar basal-body rod protein FlgC
MNKCFILAVLFVPCLANAVDLDDAFTQSAAGMMVQSQRISVISQNIANADSTGTTPGALPYRRKTILFKNNIDPKTGKEVIGVAKVSRDYKTKFQATYDPGHPAADEDGYVLLPNVSRSIETVDMKEAERSYEANLGAIETTKRMYMNTLELMR